MSLEIHGDHYEFRGLGADFKGRLHVASGGKQPRLDLIRDDGQTTANEYRLEGDSLKLIGVRAGQGVLEADPDAEVRRSTGPSSKHARRPSGDESRLLVFRLARLLRALFGLGQRR